jgi:hypothetical protein
VSGTITVAQSQALALEGYHQGQRDLCDTIREGVNAMQEHGHLTREQAELVRTVIAGAWALIPPKGDGTLAERVTKAVQQ